jgi:hypothetical protein
MNAPHPMNFLLAVLPRSSRVYGNDCWENLTAQGRKRISIYQPAWMPA